MRIRRNIIAPLILTIGAVGSLVAVPAVTALTAVDPGRHRSGIGSQRTRCHGIHGMKYHARPAARRRFPVDCGQLALAKEQRKIRGEFSGKR